MNILCSPDKLEVICSNCKEIVDYVNHFIKKDDEGFGWAVCSLKCGEEFALKRPQYFFRKGY